MKASGLLQNRVQRARAGAHWIWLEFRIPGANVHLLVVSGGRGARVAVVGRDELHAGGQAMPMAAWVGDTGERLKAAEGLRLASWSARRVILEAAEPATAVLEIMAKADRIACKMHTNREALATLGDPPPQLGAALPLGNPHALRAELAPLALAALRESVQRQIKPALERSKRREAAIAGDLDAMRKCAAQAEFACLFVVAAQRAPRGTAELRALDWRTGNPEAQVWPCAPATLPREQLERLFARNKRMSAAAPLAQARLSTAQAETARLAVLSREASVADAAQLRALAALQTQPRAQPLARELRERKLPSNGARTHPYRSFVSSVGDAILVGKGARENDILTALAKPGDLWLHAKGQRGSHVIVPLGRGKTCHPATLVEAAHLAAHFSSARGELRVEIQTSPKRMLRKPKGSAPGLVLVPHEKILQLRCDGELLARLLAAELA